MTFINVAYVLYFGTNGAPYTELPKFDAPALELTPTTFTLDWELTCVQLPYMDTTIDDQVGVFVHCSLLYWGFLGN